MDSNNTEPNEKVAAPAGKSDAAGELAGTASLEMKKGGRVRSRLVSGLRFTRHLLEMVVAMLAGMAVLGVAIWALGEPPGYSNNLLLKYVLMGGFMAAPMVGWMRYRGHSWQPSAEMAASMIVPGIGVIALLWAGAVEDIGMLLVIEHVVMLPSMLVAMLLRRDEYTGHHHHGHGAHAMAG